MLEYQDKKFGKVKLVTVTEARANFAALLQDKDTHYIITKNNKPTRVIVNYQAFEELHKKASILPSALASAAEIKSEPKGKKSFEHLSGLLAERSQELKEQDVFIEDDVAENILDVFQSRSDSLEPKNAEEDTISNRVVAEKSAQSENYFESGDEGDEASILHPEYIEEVPLTPKLKEQKPLPAVMAETSFPSEADMTPEQREYFQKYRKLYENPVPSPEITADPIPYDDVTRAVERRLAAKWGKNEFKRTERAMTQVTQQDSRLAEDEFLAEPISEDPQDPDGLPSLKDLLKDLEQETLSGDDGNKENMEKGDIDELIHRITHDY